MRVLIANPYLSPAGAELALTTEQVAYDTVYVGGDEHAYSRQLAGAFRHGEPFVLVEHDIVPWPGAIDRLAECPKPVCGHRYPRCGGLCFALGFLKVSGQALSIEPHWDEFPWWQLDGQVFQAFADAGIEPHVHEPPVAHLRLDVRP